MSHQSTPIHVLYHAHCADGFGAATVAWMVFGSQALYTACEYGKSIPVEIPDGAQVFILDFSWPFNPDCRTALEALAARTQLIVLDHHQSAREALEGLPFARFESDKSGAVMAWEYFRDTHPDIIFGEVPELLLYIQDRDLWRWERRASKEVSASLMASPKHLSIWAGYIHGGSRVILDMMNEGRVLLAAQSQMVESICAKRHLVEIPTPSGLTKVPAVNTTVLQSECCHRLLELHSEASFVVAYFIEGSANAFEYTAVFSLRSRPDFDCSVIAKHNGGGGHPQACGFKGPL